MARERRRRAARILIGIGVMIVLAATPFFILSKYAGGWGVPYFSFVTSRGTTCTNDFTGYTCDHLTRADIEWWGDLTLPTGTKILSSHYESTHDFTLDALVEIPVADQKHTLAELQKSFGDCIADHPTSMDTTGVKKLCVRANDASDPMDSSPLSDTLYEISTGYRANGALVLNIHEQSR
ncbi:hypothetical protein GCM10011575_05360 [Microlunatus endophyticus]|uniref:Uncharacterized protein n=1 Tax=Microlunatus endophyticus TaxID=1716077 RepID=A0A917VZZ6_9ACTN|nr:hypothetical protein [Microlunatus endophyticus]GGL50031.1 hypothetical protein GCM10011575_05360 [Microlunatus endophyticus]